MSYRGPMQDTGAIMSRVKEKAKKDLT